MQITRYLNKNRLVNNAVSSLFGLFISVVRFFIKKNKPHEKHLTIISLHMMGDTVFTIPAVREIINHYKDYKIFILTNPNGKVIYNLVFPELKIAAVKNNAFHLNGRIANKKTRRIINDINPEIIFDLTGTITSASLLISYSAGKIIGLNSKYYKNIYDVFIPVRKDPHLIDRYLEVVSSVVPIESRAQLIEHPVNLNPNGKILIHPFAGWAAKEWGEDKFYELAKELKNQYNVGIVGNELFKSSELNQKIKNDNIDFLVTSDLDSLVVEITKCSLFISNDSGPLYLANLLGKPTFTIYGPTNPNHSLPFGRYHKFIRKEISCTPYTDQYCHTHAGQFCPYYECMDTLTLQEVLNAILGFIESLEIVNKHKIHAN